MEKLLRAGGKAKMGHLSIIIPTVYDKYLTDTLRDIADNAELDPEVIVVDGRKIGMRSAINKGVKQSTGTYIMKCDDHCSFDKGFDKKLLDVIERNWIMVPKRYNLNVETWERMGQPMLYERIAEVPEKIGGVRWNERNHGREQIEVDETMIFQGSFYCMSRDHWNMLGGLQTEGYGEFAQEAIELSLKTWGIGGKVMVHKGTWYAHKHRKFGRVAKVPSQSIKDGNKYSRKYWINHPTYINLKKRFEV